MMSRKPGSSFENAASLLTEIAKVLRVVMRPGPEGLVLDAARDRGPPRRPSADQCDKAATKRKNALHLARRPFALWRSAPATALPRLPIARRGEKLPTGLTLRRSPNLPSTQRGASAGVNRSAIAPAATPSFQPIVASQAIARILKEIAAVDPIVAQAGARPERGNASSKQPFREQHQSASRPSDDRERDHDEPPRDGGGRGTVKWFNAGKGFGFIDPTDGSARIHGEERSHHQSHLSLPTILLPLLAQKAREMASPGESQCHLM
jgi:hypothetical protein